jgi:hypothetical protein
MHIIKGGGLLIMHAYLPGQHIINKWKQQKKTTDIIWNRTVVQVWYVQEN